jgi:hypothetical protein
LLFIENKSKLYGRHSSVVKSQTNVNFNLEQVMKSMIRSRVLLYSFFTIGARWGGWSTSRSGRCALNKDRCYLLYRRLGGLQDPSGGVRKFYHPPGFDLQIIELVASGYTDCDIPPHRKSKPNSIQTSSIMPGAVHAARWTETQLSIS